MSCSINQNQNQNQEQNQLESAAQKPIETQIYNPNPNPKPSQIQNQIIQLQLHNQNHNQNQNQNQNQIQNQLQGDNNQVSSFWTCDELLQALSQVLKLHEIFNLYARLSGRNTIDVLLVPECLHAMGLHFVDSILKTCLTERLLKFPQSKPPTRVSFELVLSIYCDLASLEEVPPAAVMLNGFRCLDIQNTGLLPFNMLRRMLTIMGERLNDMQASDLLDSLKDDKGNVKYVTLLETMFSTDIDASDKLKEVRLYLNALGSNASHMDMHKRDEFIRALRNLDANHTGYVAPDQLLKLLNTHEDRFTANELTSLTRGMINCKKQVDYRMFLSLIMNE